MQFPGRKKKKYSFSDDVIAPDTRISLIFSILSLLIIIVILVFSAAKGGHLPDRAGILLLISLVMAVTGLIFGALAYRDVEGDNNAKRWSVILSLVALALLVLLYLL